jgi:hypothetical protein
MDGVTKSIDAETLKKLRLAAIDLMGLDAQQVLYYCIEDDLKQFNTLINVEADFCEKIQHSLDLTHFISNIKPFVCLNFDPVFNAFNLVR